MSASLQIREPLGERRVVTPLRLGGADADVIVPGASAAEVRIDHSGGQYWIRPIDGARVVVNGVKHAEPLALVDGDVLQLGDAQVLFSAAPPALDVLHLAGNATVAPLQEQALPGEVVAAGAAEIHVATSTSDAVEHGVRTGSTVRGWRGLPLWLAAPVALLVAGLFVLFRLVNVPLQVAPAAARVEVPGWFSWRSSERLYLMPGAHRITVSAPGHETRVLAIDTRVSGADAAQKVELPLLPGVLLVDTGGIAGDALIDGKPAGHVPGEITAAAGAHELSIRAPRHLEFTTRIEVEGAGHRQSVQAALLPAYGWLVLDTSPGGGHVRIDDADQGNAPLRLELDAGLRRLSIAAAGRHPWNTQVAIQAGQTLDLGTINLNAAPPPPAVAPPVAAASAPESGSAPAAPPPPPPPPAARIQSALLGTLMLLPPGTFMEGSDRREQGRRWNEVQRRVTLSRPFYLAEKEVSNAQFRAFRPQHASGLALEKSLDLDSQAVSGVSWDDAVEFCNWLSLREGLPAAYERRDGRWQLLEPVNHGYRLPTEAEWEYASRYVDGQRWLRYAWGDTLPPPAGAANLGGTESLPPKPGPEMRLASALPDYRDEHAVVAPVGSYARSAAGLHDMGGNVSEWTHDVYASLPEASAVTDPFGPSREGPHAVRGPNWRSTTIAGLRLAWRDGSAAPSQTTGFRVARYVEKTP